jgi:Tol biopolymer transport system component/DNA-binding winged helix-turn-helix (wHTH) protein
MADVPTPARQSIRFGIFELDLQSGDLRKAGVLVGLQEQSLKVLVELLERPGELVHRERLRQRLWPDGSFVDFDHGLNAVINRLRETLGDSADSPRFIQTVPRRGYRFIAPVERAVYGQEVRGQPARDSGHLRPESGDPDSAGHQGVVRRRHRSVMWSAAVLALGLSAVLALYLSWLRPSPLGPMRTIPLTTLPGRERYPSFSPDGGRIAFVWDGENSNNDGAGYAGGDIYVKVINTEVPLRLTTSPAAEGYPVWSPDGSHIVFVRASAGGSELVVIPSLGGAERKIHSRSSSLDNCSGAMSWSADGQLLAIADREGDQTTCSIFLLSLETLQKRKLTSPPDPGLGDYAPAFSPDGRTIAFNRLSPAGGGIYVVPAAGGDPKRVTLEPYVWHERLAWLPTGRELLFSSTRSGDRAPDGAGSLWRVSASGATPERLGVGGDNAANPAVAPRGNRLAYEQRYRNSNIWKIALPQSSRPAPAPSQLIASSRQDGAPHVSPDGTRIAFLSDRSGTIEIWLCDTAGSNLVQLTTSGGSVGTPRWSPDSRQLAFEAFGRGHMGISVISAEGGLPRHVTTDPSAAVLASWSSDGRWIYFASSRTGRFEVWKVRAEGGRAVQVTKRGGFLASEAADGTFVYYAKGLDVGGLWKVPVNGGDETAVLDFPKASFWGYWALVNDGIYFVDTEVGSQPALRFFSFGTGRVSDVMTLDGKPIAHETGMAISPDGRWLLYEQADYRSVDIMLVENFH